MSEHPTTPQAVAFTPQMAAVIADAMETAENRTAADLREHNARRRAAERRAAQGNPEEWDAAYLEAADYIRQGIEAMAEAQAVARQAFEDIAGDLAATPVAAARAWVDA